MDVSASSAWSTDGHIWTSSSPERTEFGHAPRRSGLGHADFWVVPPNLTPRQRLAQAVADERATWVRQISQRELARRAGLSRSTMDAVVNARGEGGFSPTTLSSIDAAMGWTQGSAEAVLVGGRPQRIEDRERIELQELWPRLTPQARRAVLEVARAALRGH